MASTYWPLLDGMSLTGQGTSVFAWQAYDMISMKPLLQVIPDRRCLSDTNDYVVMQILHLNQYLVGI